MVAKKRTKGCPQLSKALSALLAPQPIQDQPAPKPSNSDVWLMVMADMQRRRQTGIERYGTPLQAGNGRDALVDAYQEALDLAVYLRQAIAERDGYASK